MNSLYNYLLYSATIPKSSSLFGDELKYIDKFKSKYINRICKYKISSFRLTEEPRPCMPNIVFAGGIHCKPPKPLPRVREAMQISLIYSLFFIHNDDRLINLTKPFKHICKDNCISSLYRASGSGRMGCQLGRRWIHFFQPWLSRLSK